MNKADWCTVDGLHVPHDARSMFGNVTCQGEDGHVAEDEVNPSHYKRSLDVLGVEVFDILQFFFPEDPIGWQVGKYALRAGHKDSELTDWHKLVWYAQKKVEQLEADA